MQLTTPDDSGEIVFSNGKVVAAFRTGGLDSVGDGLLAAGVINVTRYQELLAAEAEGVRGRALFDRFELVGEPVDHALQDLLKRIIFAMFEWSDGTFSFVLDEQPELWRGFLLSGTRVVVDGGLNPQYLAIEGARVRDERSKEDSLETFLARDLPPAQPKPPARRAEAQSFAHQLLRGEAEETTAPTAKAVIEAAAPRVTPTAVSGGLHVLVVDDDPQVAAHIERFLRSRVASVKVVGKVGAALAALAEMPVPHAVLTDLIIARSDGRGILGGIEILERVRADGPSTPVVLFTDYENVEAEARARAMGVQGFLMKPRKAQIQAGAADRPDSPLGVFLARLWDIIEPLVASAPVQAAAPSKHVEDPRREAATWRAYDLGREIARELGDGDDNADSELPTPVASEGAMEVLRSMLAELIDPANRDTVTLLVLRFASNVVERAALFLASRQAFVGLGGFSADEDSDRFVARVRAIKIPTDSDSIFRKVVHYRTAARAPLADSVGNRLLIEGLGGERPTGEAVAIPLVSRDRVAVVLYGDNPSGQPLGATDALEIFLQQAGLAMDRALLERKLEESRRGRGVDADED